MKEYSDNHHQQRHLINFLCQKILEHPDQRITFAQYMNWVLYHPDYGYYETHASDLGKKGDFFTAVHLGSDFGELLAEQFVQMWQILDHPAPFTLLEMGAGQGILAADILTYVQQKYPEFYEVLNYLILEKSSALRLVQQERLPAFNQNESSPMICWQTWETIPEKSIIGCCFSNELVDAFPVHQIVIHQGQIQEVYVTVQEIASLKFEEVLAQPSTPKIASYFDLIDVKFPSELYEEGYRTEVNLGALDWLTTVANKLKMGYLLTIDYGYPAHRYYHPRRREGTLQCYYQHQRHSNPYLYIGEQDLTTHIDFTALEKQGELCGLNRVGWTQQALFLMALGLGERMAALSFPDPESPPLDFETVLRRRDAFHQLIDPMGLGGFGVLIQSRGLTTEMAGVLLRGLSVPG